MKKILALSLLFCLTLTMFGQSTSPRFGTAKNQDNTGRILNYKTQTVTLTNTDSIMPNAYYTYIVTSTMTHAETFGLQVTNAHKCDVAEIKFTCDTLTAGRVVTFQTTTGGNTILWTTTTGNTVTVKKSKSVVMRFIFDGTVWMEETRSIQF